MNMIRRAFGWDKPLVRVITMSGRIKDGRGKNLNIYNLEKQIERAFDCKKVKPKAVVLELNSPGGSAVQSNLIYSRVRNLAEKNSLPVITVIEDRAVSGGFWLALAGDEIYADANSAVGHIGVISMLFGLEEAIKKLGIESRMLSAGKYKVRLDPFKPLKEDDEKWMNGYLQEVHANFIELVKSRRKNLNVDHKTVFEADIFTGKKAVTIGLIDGISSDMNHLMRQKFGDDVVIKRIEPKSRFPFGFSGIGAELKVDTEEIVDGVADASLKNRLY